MEIRWAEKRDLERLTEIFNYEVVNATSSFARRPRTAEEREAWFEEHDWDTHPLIVAEMDGRVAGYASLSTFRSYEAYEASVELSVYVDSDVRGQGIGKALMEHILGMARENDRIHTVISVITGDNETSIRLHEKFGFDCCGTLKEVGFKFGRYLDAAFYQLPV